MVGKDRSVSLNNKFSEGDLVEIKKVRVLTFNGADVTKLVKKELQDNEKITFNNVQTVENEWYAKPE